jgi:hypothetical protein
MDARFDSIRSAMTICGAIPIPISIAIWMTRPQTSEPAPQTDEPWPDATAFETVIPVGDR